LDAAAGVPVIFAAVMPTGNVVLEEFTDALNSLDWTNIYAKPIVVNNPEESSDEDEEEDDEEEGVEMNEADRVVDTYGIDNTGNGETEDISTEMVVEGNDESITSVEKAGMVISEGEEKLKMIVIDILSEIS
jgi:hypothetical protein